MTNVNIYGSSTNIMNRATRVIAATLGVIFGISGMGHGFIEA